MTISDILFLLFPFPFPFDFPFPFYFPLFPLIGVVDAIFFNQGEVCSAGSRLLVQQSVYHQLIAKVKERMTKLRSGSSIFPMLSVILGFRGPLNG